MGMSLREILDLQRRQREEAQQNTGVRVGNGSPETKKEDNALASSPVPAPTAREGLLARLQSNGSTQPKNGGDTNTGTVLPAERIATPQPASPSPAPVASSPSPVFADAEIESLKKNLAFLAANMDEKEIIGQVLRSTVRQIQQHPELNAVMIDSDFDLICAAARRSTKFVQRKKEETTEKRGKKAQEKAELERFLKDNGLDF